MSAQKKTKQERSMRTHKISFLLNDKEMQVLSAYCKRKKIRNRSGFIRRTLVQTILKRNEIDSPTLFD